MHKSYCAKITFFTKFLMVLICAYLSFSGVIRSVSAIYKLSIKYFIFGLFFNENGRCPRRDL